MITLRSRSLQTIRKVPVHETPVEREQAEIRADLASGKRVLFKVMPVTSARSSVMLDVYMAEELGFVVRQLRQVREDLSTGPAPGPRLAIQLQSLDFVEQVLTSLGRIVASADKVTAVDMTTPTELRLRLSRGSTLPLADW